MTTGTDLVLVGGGRMGGALLRSWRARGRSAESIRVIEPERQRSLELHAAYGVDVVASAEQIDEPADTLVIAVKPQMMSEVLPGLQHLADGRTLIVSIAAGTTIATFERAFGEHAAIVRAMPNTPAAIGAGMTVLYANPHVNGEQAVHAEALLAAVGAVDWVTEEAQMHAVTALSGSGPAYVFHLVEAMTAAGVEAGLQAGLAERLARQTVIGAAGLLAAEPTPAATLRRNVTSPGGTTEAALRRLMRQDDGLTRLMTESVADAATRSKALG